MEAHNFWTLACPPRKLRPSHTSIARNLHVLKPHRDNPPSPSPPPPFRYVTPACTRRRCHALNIFKTNSWTCSSMASTSKHEFEMVETCFCKSLAVAGAPFNVIRQNSRGAALVDFIFGSLFFFFNGSSHFAWAGEAVQTLFREVTDGRIAMFTKGSRGETERENINRSVTHPIVSSMSQCRGCGTRSMHHAGRCS